VEELSMAQRRAVSGVTAQEYRRASHKDKSKILTLMCRQTKLNRVYLAWLLRSWGKEVAVSVNGKPIRFVGGVPRPRRRRQRPRRYAGAVVEVITKLWYLFDFMCGKRLAAVLRRSLDTLAATGELPMSPSVRQKLATISPATIDRLLAGQRHKMRVKGRGLTKPGTLLKHQIPIRTFSEWQEDRPGFMEFDTVGHQGPNSYGDFALTLNGTNVATGWTEPRAVPNKARRWTREALVEIRSRLPFPLGCRLGQRQRVHQRSSAGMVHRRAHHLHPQPPLPQERHLLHRAEELVGGPSAIAATIPRGKSSCSTRSTASCD
jgi:hypothetical protein